MHALMIASLAAPAKQGSTHQADRCRAHLFQESAHIDSRVRRSYTPGLELPYSLY